MGLTCPANLCRADNDIQAEVCVRCGTPLHGYARLSAYPALLFNQGLSAARTGNMAQARDAFAAVVYWCPLDQEARNALALACFALGDQTQARSHWERVLTRSPENEVATQGLAALASEIVPQVATESLSLENELAEQEPTTFASETMPQTTEITKPHLEARSNESEGVTSLEKWNSKILPTIQKAGRVSRDHVGRYLTDSKTSLERWYSEVPPAMQKAGRVSRDHVGRYLTDSKTSLERWKGKVLLVAKKAGKAPRATISCFQCKQPITHSYCRSCRISYAVPGYDLLHDIGAGGFATVYLGKDKETGQLVAVKLAAASQESDKRQAKIIRIVEEERKSLQLLPPNQEIANTVLSKEATILRNIHDGRFVKVVSDGSFDIYHYLVLEYIEGISLYEWMIKRQNLHLQHIINIVDTLSTLGDLKHGDLKPENILITPEGAVRLIDPSCPDLDWIAHTDLASPESPLGGKRYLLTTPIYNPLLCHDDVISLGVILYGAATGYYPFLGNLVLDEEALQTFICPSYLNPNIPFQLDNLIMQCLGLEERPDGTICSLGSYASLEEAKEALVLLLHDGHENLSIPKGDTADHIAAVGMLSLGEKSEAHKRRVLERLVDNIRQGIIFPTRASSFTVKPMAKTTDVNPITLTRR